MESGVSGIENRQELQENGNMTFHEVLVALIHLSSTIGTIARWSIIVPKRFIKIKRKVEIEPF